MPEHPGSIQCCDGKVRERLDRRQRGALRSLWIQLLRDLAHLPGRSRRTENHIHLLLSGLGQRDRGFHCLDGSDDRRECVENLKERVHAWMLDAAVRELSTLTVQALDLRPKIDSENW